MSGVKGRSGGARPGAGRKKKPATPLPDTIDKPVSADNNAVADGFGIAEAITHKDPQVFLMAVMNDAGTDAKLRVDAAKALMPYLHKKVGEDGKKGERQAAAKRAAAGRFAAPPPPKLIVNNK